MKQCPDVAESVSIQPEVSAFGTRAVFSGAMRTVRGSFTGYASPLAPSSSRVADEPEEWGTALGRHPAGHGYAGPFGLDAVVDTADVTYASERSIRRTAATTPHAMVTRLTAGSAAPPAGRSWRYAVIARSSGDVEEQESALAEALEFEGG